MAIKAPRAGIRTSIAPRLRRSRPQSVIGQVGRAEASALAQASAATDQIGSALAQQQARKDNFARNKIMSEFTAEQNAFMQGEQNRTGADAEGSQDRHDEFVGKFKSTIDGGDEQLMLDLDNASMASRHSLGVRENGIMRNVRLGAIDAREMTHQNGLMSRAQNVDWTTAGDDTIDDILGDAADVRIGTETDRGLELGTAPQKVEQDARLKFSADRRLAYRSLLDNIKNSATDTADATDKFGKLESMAANDADLTDSEREAMGKEGRDLISRFKREDAARMKAVEAQLEAQRDQLVLTIGQELAKIRDTQGEEAMRAKQAELQRTHQDPKMRDAIKKQADKTQVVTNERVLNELRSHFASIPPGREAEEMKNLNELYKDPSANLSVSAYNELKGYIDGSVDKNKRTMIDSMLQDYNARQLELQFDDADDKQLELLSDKMGRFLSDTFLPLANDKNVTLRELNQVSKEFKDEMGREVSKENMKRMMFRMQDRARKIRSLPGDQIGRGAGLDQDDLRGEVLGTIGTQVSSDDSTDALIQRARSILKPKQPELEQGPTFEEIKEARRKELIEDVRESIKREPLGRKVPFRIPRESR